MRTTHEQDEATDGYLYNGEIGIRAPVEANAKSESKVTQQQPEGEPVPRRFSETESFQTRITYGEEDLFRMPISLPRLTYSPPAVPVCDKCKNPRTHRYSDGKKLWYVCAKHAAEGKESGHEVYGPPLTKG